MAYCMSQGSEKYRDHFEPGIYVCAECGQQLFHGKAKYAHHTPWPAFEEPITSNSIIKEVETEPQTSSDKPALKVFCSGCKSELGHEFVGDGPNGISRF